MNDDRISEVYRGEIWAEPAQERARRRINWICTRAFGDRVIDIGTSQGIASILLGREGFEVVGVDIQPDRIEYATADLAKESQGTQERVQFMVAEGSDLPFESDSFDTVLLGEVIEHLAAPGRVLDEASRILRPGGRIVITTPFGVLHHHDHKQTYYPDDVLELVSSRFGVVEAGVSDRYFRIVGELGTDTPAEISHHLVDQAFVAVKGIQEELASTRIRANRLDIEVEKLKTDVAKRTSAGELSDRKIAQLTRSLETWETRHDKVKVAWQESKASAKDTLRRAEQADKTIDSLTNEVQLANQHTEQADKTIDSLTKEVQGANRRADRAAQDNASLRHRAESLAKNIGTLEHKNQVSEWKLASMRRRRWWRLGSLLGEARRHPSKLLTLPVNAVRLARSRTPALPRPPLALKAASSDPDKPDPCPRRPSNLSRGIIPRLDVPVAALLSQATSELLRFEVQLFDLDPDTWAAALGQLAPDAVITEPVALAEWPVGAVTALLSACRTRGIRTILWSADASVPDDTSLYDAVVTSSAANNATDAIIAQGLIQPMVHNPIGAHNPDLRTATVDFSEMRIGQSSGLTESELHRIAKRYRVITAGAGTTPADAARIVASGTALIVGDGDLPCGAAGKTEEERDTLRNAIVRSDVLGARIFHPQRRQLFRQHDMSSDIRRAIGKEDTDDIWPQIDVMVATKRPERLKELMANLGHQTYPNLRLFLVAHGVDLDETRVADVAAEYGVALADVAHVDESVILGDVFNIGFNGTESEFIAKIDDDDFYGPEYFWDLYSALDFSGAEVAGKWAHYVYLEGIDSLIYRFKKYENRFTDVVAISTLLMRRGVLDLEQFPAMPYGSGSVFLRALGQHGARVFAADRWNYLYVRGQDGGRNTFPISDLKMLTNSDVVCRGMIIPEVVV